MRFASSRRTPQMGWAVTHDRKPNCWEYKRCGREPGGAGVATSGPCAAATESRLDGENGGVNGGRACWVIPGTLCDGTVCGSFDEKYLHCRKCDFFELVQEQEGAAYVDYVRLLVKLASEPEVAQA